MAPATPELDVLRERDPAVEDTNDWDEFVLTKAFVHEPGNERELVSLLVAEAGNPVTVVGTLEPLDADDHNLYLHKPKKDGAKKVTVILEDVRQFAFGEVDDSPALWAAGRAGWHQIHPSKQYKRIYDEMCEGVRILYYIVDAYRTERYEGRGKNRTLLKDYTAQEIFENYAREELDTEDTEVASAKIYSHKDFLISSMLAGREGLAWTKYPLCKHLYKRFPDTVAMLRKRREPPFEAKANSTRARHTRKNSADTTSTVTSKPPRTRSTRQNSVETVSTRNAKPEDARLRRTRQGSADTSSTTSSLKRKRTRAAKGGVIEVISLDGTSDASGSVQEVPEEQFMEADVARSRAPAKTKSAPTRRTRNNPTILEPEPEPAVTPAKDSESDEEIRAREQKNKSSLRPRASKASKSAARNGGKGPKLDDHDGDEDEPDPPSSPLPGKRKHVDETDETLHRRRPKRRNSRPHDDEGIDIPTSPDSSSGDMDLPLRLAHIQDPVQEDTWVCALDGCTHKVYASSHPDSQRLIREHYALHAYDDDVRVQMVKKVEAPSLPVSRLMEKVKMRAKAEGFPGSISSSHFGSAGPGPDMPENVRSRFGVMGQIGGVVQRY